MLWFFQIFWAIYVAFYAYLSSLIRDVVTNASQCLSSRRPRSRLWIIMPAFNVIVIEKQIGATKARWHGHWEQPVIRNQTNKEGRCSRGIYQILILYGMKCVRLRIKGLAYRREFFDGSIRLSNLEDQVYVTEKEKKETLYSY